MEKQNKSPSYAPHPGAAIKATKQVVTEGLSSETGARKAKRRNQKNDPHKKLREATDTSIGTTYSQLAGAAAT